MLGCMPLSVLNPQLAAEDLKTRLGYGFVNEQREVKGVVPLHQTLTIVVGMKMVTDLWLRMSPC